ncbi:restriction endonuclease subunit S [Streptococcus oralis]|uniref:restriction endonuclease subunit S n=1 Tax=Streptococcus oralis TaxID=1303 RepID=UPI0022845629|nr:restriction endonuclease subunit S [Streptococcus oralis]MCY7065245.1 restriction endonuclease subunit S [Streptococcus oralis]
MSEWIKAEEYCVSVFDGTHDTPKVTETGYKLVTSKNILSNTLDLNSAYYISEEDFANINKRSKVKQYDILFSMIGTVGSLYFETSDTIDYAIKNIGVFSCGNKEKAEWLYYYLQSSYAQQYIKRYLNGAVQKFLPLKGLREFPVPQFNKELHNRIKILLNIDQKIQINNQINRELEDMAKTLYDYWFVQFDFPDQNGKPYKSSGGKMVYNPELKREIPEGWGVDSLWNIANFYNGLAMQKYRPDTNEDDYLPVIKIREMMNGFSKDTEKARLDIPTEAVVERGDILFSWSATLEVIIWGKERGALNQHIFKVTSDTYPKSFIYFELKSYLKVFKAIAELRKTTMGHITQDHLKQAKIVVPPIEIISKLDAKLQPIMLKQQILENQNEELTQLRDWLLPMLMNGQVYKRIEGKND